MFEESTQGDFWRCLLYNSVTDLFQYKSYADLS